MNLKLTNNGSKLNENMHMRNTDSLSLTNLQWTDASFSACDSMYIISNEITGETLDIPTKLLTVTIYKGKMYFDITSKSLRIYDGTHWFPIVLTQVP